MQTQTTLLTIDTLESIAMNVVDGERVYTACYAGEYDMVKEQSYSPKTSAGNSRYGDGSRVSRVATVRRQWDSAVAITAETARRLVERSQVAGREISRQRYSETCMVMRFA